MRHLNLSTVPLTHGFMVGCRVGPRAAEDWRLPISVVAKPSVGARKGIIYDLI
jgi:hypothetical protein